MLPGTTPPRQPAEANSSFWRQRKLTSQAPDRPPLVSIGLPVFERPEALRHALQVLQTQTYRPLEIVISENRSDSGLLVDLDEMESSGLHFKISSTTANIGAIANFETTIERATGEYFMWLDVEDWINPLYIEVLVRRLRDSHACMATPEVVYVAGETIYSEPPLELLIDDPQMRDLCYWRALVSNGWLFGLIDRRTLSTLLPLPRDYAWDWIFMSRIARWGRVAGEPRALLVRAASEKSRYDYLGEVGRGQYWRWLHPVLVWWLVRRDRRVMNHDGKPTAGFVDRNAIQVLVTLVAKSTRDSRLGGFLKSRGRRVLSILRF